MIHCDKIEACLAELFNTLLSNNLSDAACLCEVSKQTKWLLCANCARKTWKTWLIVTRHIVSPPIPPLWHPWDKLAIDPSIPRGVTLLLNGPLWWCWKLPRRLCIVDWVTSRDYRPSPLEYWGVHTVCTLVTGFCSRGQQLCLRRRIVSWLR